MFRMCGRYGIKPSDILPSIGCPECEEDTGLNQVIYCLSLDVQNVKKMWDWTK
jgi:hypothetical protein